jgi:hypothetical protein
MYKQSINKGFASSIKVWMDEKGDDDTAVNSAVNTCLTAGSIIPSRFSRIDNSKNEGSCAEASIVASKIPEYDIKLNIIIEIRS